MVTVGQVYADKDRREAGRHLRVDDVRDGRARCFECRPDGTVFGYRRSTRIRVDRLERRFRLVVDAAPRPGTSQEG